MVTIVPQLKNSPKRAIYSFGGTIPGARHARPRNRCRSGGAALQPSELLHHLPVLVEKGVVRGHALPGRQRVVLRHTPLALLGGGSALPAVVRLGLDRGLGAGLHLLALAARDGLALVDRHILGGLEIAEATAGSLDPLAALAAVSALGGARGVTATTRRGTGVTAHLHRRGLGHGGGRDAETGSRDHGEANGGHAELIGGMKHLECSFCTRTREGGVALSSCPGRH